MTYTLTGEKKNVNTNELFLVSSLLHQVYIMIEKFFPALPTPEEMRCWDAHSIECGVLEFTLMENAARAALCVLQERYASLCNVPVLLFMGNGNNGGDAACLARLLNDVGARPCVMHTKSLSEYRGTTGQHVRLARRVGVPCVRVPKGVGRLRHLLDSVRESKWQGAWPQIVIDGLLGTGFSGVLRQSHEEIIHFINDFTQSAFVFALDVPSGCDAMTGEACPIAVRAHATVCFAAAKPGIVMPSARQWTGELHIKPIGIPRTVHESIGASYYALTTDVELRHTPCLPKVASLMPKGKAQSHKNMWGHVLVLGGSHGLTGAAHLAAMAALRTGAGLVTVAAPHAWCADIKAGIADIMTLPLDTKVWPQTLPDTLLQRIDACHAIAIGPGMGTDDDARAFMHAVLSLERRPPAVIDADALHILAKDRSLFTLIRADDILTPHPLEAARLLSVTDTPLSATAIQARREDALRALIDKAPCVWLLKGAGALLGQGCGATGVLPHDIPALAVAGSGDVLTGCIAALVARLKQAEHDLIYGQTSLRAAALGLIIHARAGLFTQKSFPARGNGASDIVQRIPLALQYIEELTG